MELFAYLQVAQDYESIEPEDLDDNLDDIADFMALIDRCGQVGISALLALTALWSTALSGAAQAVEEYNPGFRPGADSTFVPVAPAATRSVVPLDCANALCRTACGDNASSGSGSTNVVAITNPTIVRPVAVVGGNNFVPVRPAPPTGVFMRRGDVGPEIVQLQNLLRNAGYFDAASTGFFASLTEAGVRAFQRDRGLDADGIVGEQTFAALGGFRPITPTPLPAPLPPQPVQQLQIGDRGPAVVQLQLVLQNLGFYDGPLDGIYAASTEQAVIAFQQARGIPVSGIADATTLAQLGINPNQVAAR